MSIFDCILATKDNESLSRLGKDVLGLSETSSEPVHKPVVPVTHEMEKGDYLFVPYDDWNRLPKVFREKARKVGAYFSGGVHFRNSSFTKFLVRNLYTLPDNILVFIVEDKSKGISVVEVHTGPGISRGKWIGSDNFRGICINKGDREHEANGTD